MYFQVGTGSPMILLNSAQKQYKQTLWKLQDDSSRLLKCYIFSICQNLFYSYQDLRNKRLFERRYSNYPPPLLNQAVQCTIWSYWHQHLTDNLCLPYLNILYWKQNKGIIIILPRLYLLLHPLHINALEASPVLSLY